MLRLSTSLALMLLAASLAVADTIRTTTYLSIVPYSAEYLEGQSVELNAVVIGHNTVSGHPPPLPVWGMVYYYDLTNNLELGYAYVEREPDGHNVARFTYGPLSGLSRTLEARFYGTAAYDTSISTQVRLTINQSTATLLVQFDATCGPDGIELRWSFADASRVSSAEVERSQDASGPWSTVHPELRRDGDVTAALDRTTEPGQGYFYRLDAKLVDGSSVMFGPISSMVSTRETAVSVVAPNPARTASHIQYSVARAGRVRLDVTDVAGRVVATLLNGVQPPGSFQAVWDGTNRGERLPSGLYFVRLTTLDRTVFKMIARLQ